MDFYLVFLIINQVPLFICILNYRKLEKAQKFFGLFLLWGALVDAKYYLPLSDAVHDHIYLIFTLTEVMFYMWFMFQISEKIFLNKLLRNSVYVFIPVFWLISTFLLEDDNDNDIYSGLYDGTTAALLASTSSYLIYKLTLKGIPLGRIPNFWFLSGIFFYFFCCVFIFSIMSKEVADGAWMVHIVINTATMIIYAIGYYVAGKRAIISTNVN